MNPTFFHELPLVVLIQGKPELVEFAAGFSKEVDALSGMTYNLKDILAWQHQWMLQSRDASFAGWMDYLSVAQRFFATRASSEALAPVITQVRFFDQALLRLEAGRFFLQRTFPMYDSFGHLRVFKILVLVGESELERLRRFVFSEQFPGSFDEFELILNFFESKLGVAPESVEIKDPETQISLML